MFVDIISVEETLGYLNYVDQFTSVYESDDVEVDVYQLLDSIQD